MKELREIYRASGLPVLQNKVFDQPDDARACTTGDVVLVQDPETGLIFNHAFDPQLVRYDAGYQNEQANSAVFRQHLSEVADLLEIHFSGLSLVEVGCGKGTFLRMLRDRGFSVLGFDPSYEGDDPLVRKAAFDAFVEIRADAVILRHVLEHIPQPLEFLRQVRDANGGGGLVFIEVPCFDWIRENGAWFDIFYEHVNYFRLSDLERMFFDVRASGPLFGGQYIFVIADLATLKSPACEPSHDPPLPSGFEAGIDVASARISRAREEGRLNAVWGAASKGVIFSIVMERRGTPVDVAIDLNPAKQGRFLPVTGLRVVGPKEATRTVPLRSMIHVMNSNYLGEIMEMSEHRYEYVTLEQT